MVAATVLFVGRTQKSGKKPGVVGRLLRPLREARGLSQEKLAEKAGVSRLTITHLETGESQTADSDTVRALARALDVRPGALIEEPEEAFAIDRVIAAFLKSPYGQAARPTGDELRWLRSLDGQAWLGFPAGGPSPKAIFQLLEAFRADSPK